MAALKRTLSLILVMGLTIFGAALAQDGEAQDQQRTMTVGGEEFLPVGEIEVGEPAPFETDTRDVDVDVETGALIFTGETPGDQHPNVDLVGPDGYFEHFEFPDDPGEEQVIDGLLPGVYSVAATDDGLQLAHSLVEVTAGQATRVNVSLQQAATDFVPGGFVADDRRVFPDRGFRFGDPARIDSPEFGSVAIDTENEDARFVITGPDNYSQEFSGDFNAQNLLPGIYVIAGTADGSQIATSTFEVEVSTATTMVPVLEVTAETEEIDGGVAGGGQAEDDQAEDAQDPADDQSNDETESEDAAEGDEQQN